MSLSTSCHLEAYEEEKNEGNHTEASVPPVQALLREQTHRKTHYFYKEGPISRWNYIKMVFDFKKWRQDSMSLMSSTISGIYATLLICIYLTFSFTELVKFPTLKTYQDQNEPDLQGYLEKRGFFIYLFLGCNLYYVYILISLLRAKKTDDPIVVENSKSHGSVTVRYGAIIFGLGAFCYFFIELLVFLEQKPESPCFHPLIGANTIMALLFVFLQTYIIFMYPRLNFQCHKFFNRMATMHLVATNIIIWIRTLIKESLEEIEEYEETETKHGTVLRHTENPEQCDFLLDRMRVMEKMNEDCHEYSRNFLRDDILTVSSPYLYPFIIEYSLIGASVAYIMSNHIGRIPNEDSEVNRVHKPHPIRHILKSDFTHTFKGTIAGLIIMGAAIINLVLFFGFDGRETMRDEAEYVSKISNTIINLVGIIALIIGIAELHHLETREDSADGYWDLDLFLLRFTSFFSFLYMLFTMITGAFNHHIEDFPNELHIINGLCDLLQIILQLCFIQSLKQKEYFSNQEYIMPGRQITIFLFLFNLAQWIVFTFEIQKVRASQVEEDFYGFMPWVLIRRVTLPLAVFFRFHSAVVSIELWKEVYHENTNSNNHELNTLPAAGDSTKI